MLFRIRSFITSWWISKTPKKSQLSRRTSFRSQAPPATHTASRGAPQSKGSADPMDSYRAMRLRKRKQYQGRGAGGVSCGRTAFWNGAVTVVLWSCESHRRIIIIASSQDTTPSRDRWIYLCRWLVGGGWNLTPFDGRGHRPSGAEAVGKAQHRIAIGCHRGTTLAGASARGGRGLYGGGVRGSRGRGTRGRAGTRGHGGTIDPQDNQTNDKKAGKKEIVVPSPCAVRSLNQINDDCAVHRFRLRRRVTAWPEMNG